MPKHIVLILSALAATICARLAVAQSEWLPADARQGITAQLVQKLSDTPLAQDRSEDEIVADALTAVDAMASQLDILGRQAVVDKAPSLADLEVPSLGDDYADAMLKYGLCSAFMDAVHGDRDLDSSEPRMRAAAAVNGTAVILVSLYLRHAFVQAGGTDEELKRLFYDSPWEFKPDQDSMREIARDCVPALSAIADF